MTFSFKWFRRLARQALFVMPILLAASLVGLPVVARASLETYDAAIANDIGDGLVPVSRLTTPAAVNGTARAAFDFGNVTGDATFEFILEGDSTPSFGAVCLAVGSNTKSVLRYEQWQNTGKLGFTQLGVEDYFFNPSIPSPRGPLHLVYAWKSSERTMWLYLNGLKVGSRSGVDNGFAMPTGPGYLGGDQNDNDLLFGTYHRVTIYNSVLSEDAIRRHSDTYHGILRPPTIDSFSASPAVLFTPASAVLSWSVQGAAAVYLNGMLTGGSNLTVTPIVTTIYTLVASNQDGMVSAQTTVNVNPTPEIKRFSASRVCFPAGQSTTLTWEAQYGQGFAISPDVGDVTKLTTNGVGAIVVQPPGIVTYTLTVSNPWGASAAEVQVQPTIPASHLVISEFMADNKTGLCDEDNDHSGWIEIHNPTSNSVSLAGHFLTDDAANPVKWAFPATNLAAGEFLLVFASGKDRAQAGATLHSNFKLNNEGEYLALVGPGPSIVHAYSPEYPSQREDVSYGLPNDDVNLPRYLGAPTPGAPNDDTTPRPGKVHISPKSGTFTDSVTVILSAPDAGAEIRYTLDGSEPSLTKGQVYTAPLDLTNTTRLRAVAIVGGEVSRMSGAGYIRLAPELANYRSPLPMMVIENFGAGVIKQKGWSTTGSGIKQVPRQAAMWATFDRVDGGESTLTNSPQMINLAGIRGRGAYSCTWRQKPYSVEAMDEDGAEEKVAPLDMPAHADWILYFPDPDYDKDPTFMENTFIYELSRNCGRYSVRFRWVEAFINEDGGALRLSDRRGVYAIIEKVARGADRLDFQQLSADGTQGSWLVNINRMDPEPEYGWPAPNGAVRPWFFHTAGPNRIAESAPNNSVGGDDEPQQSNGYLNFDNPNGYVINTNQRAAIEGWFKQFEDVLWNDSLWRNPTLGYRKYLDPVDFADYFILNVLTRNGDGMLISMFPWKGDDGKLRMGPAWDYNYGSYYVSGSATGDLMYRSDRLWYKRLFNDPDFCQLYIDRWWDHRRGPMSDTAIDAIIDRQVNEITPAKSLLNGMPSTTTWDSRVAQMKTWLKQRANWIDSNYLRPPVFEHPGGAVSNGFQVVIRGDVGTLYFTLDGSDPRAMGGAVAATARSSKPPIPLTASAKVSARMKNGASWSGLTTATYTLPQDVSELVITEIMYNPPATGRWSGDDLEFLELKNTGTTNLDLSLYHFTSGMTFAFTNGTTLEPDKFFLLARNAAAIQERYPGVAVNGIYTGKLDNSGETLRLATPDGMTVLAVTYNDRASWPLAADGFGYSIVPINESNGNSDDGAHWRASSGVGGSPGGDDSESQIPPVVINEILSHAETPGGDFIELYNPTTQNADVSGWFLSDDGVVPWKFQFPSNSVIPAMGYFVLTETNFNPVSATLYNFAVDSSGDTLYLCSGDGTNLTGYSHGVRFGGAEKGVSFGRFMNSVREEQFPAQMSVTEGSANVGPRVGSLLITEIMYNPPLDGDEYVEIQNVTNGEVPFSDPSNLGNGWRLSGLDFSFPTNIVLPPRGLLLLVATNPAAFRAKYEVPTDVLVLGPYIGVLQDSGERLELLRPGISDEGGVSYITVDAVRYSNEVPWPTEVNGSGLSLHRRPTIIYGDDPASWEVAQATPGRAAAFALLPLIVQVPLSQTVVEGGTAVFSVAVTNSATLPLTNRWSVNTRSYYTNVTADYVDFLVLTNVQLSVSNVHVTVANSASPGGIDTPVAVVTVLADSDADGLPDPWETAMGFSTNNAADGVADTDGDGMTNCQEFVAGTDPTNAFSYLSISASLDTNGAIIRFGAVSNKTYAVEYRDGLTDGGWIPWEYFPAQTQNHVEILRDPGFVTNRFYRIKTPARP